VDLAEDERTMALMTNMPSTSNKAEALKENAIVYVQLFNVERERERRDACGRQDISELDSKAAIDA
jgi:hypothetical protein